MTPDTLSIPINRRIDLWRYSISHRQLLLMAPADASNPARLWIYLKGVEHIDIPTSIDCASVVSDDAKAPFTRDGEMWRAARQLEPGEVNATLFPLALQSKGARHSLTAVVAIIGEDGEAYDAPIPVGLF